MTELASRYAELERQLRRGVIAHLAHGSVPARMRGCFDVSLAPEPVEHRWQRIVDALPDSLAEREWLMRHLHRRRVRYGCRRLRAGNEHLWQRPLAVVRAETTAALDALGHAGLARLVGGTQLELGL
jgi:hypothetical protein